MDLKTLPALTVLSDNVTVVEIDQVKVVRVIHEKATAGISLHGGHVVSFTPAGHEDLIWMSEKAIFDGKKPCEAAFPFAGHGLAVLQHRLMVSHVLLNGSWLNIARTITA